jgi:hypothetical protein
MGFFLPAEIIAGKASKRRSNLRVGEWASGRVGEWASGRVGEWASGRVGEWASGRVGELVFDVDC